MIKSFSWPGVIVHTCNPSTGEASQGYIVSLVSKKETRHWVPTVNLMSRLYNRNAPFCLHFYGIDGNTQKMCFGITHCWCWWTGISHFGLESSDNLKSFHIFFTPTFASSSRIIFYHSVVLQPCVNVKLEDEAVIRGSSERDKGAEPRDFVGTDRRASRSQPVSSSELVYKMVIILTMRSKWNV